MAKQPNNRAKLSKALHANLPTYYPTKGDMVAAINRNLAVVGAKLDDTDCMDLPGSAGHKVVGIVRADEEGGADEFGDTVGIGYASVSWYRMDSGRYELTAYIA